MPSSAETLQDDVEFDGYEEDLISIEDATMHRVSRTMSAIESAIESWKAAGKKPPSLRKKIIGLQRFYDDLVKWEKRSLVKSREKNIDARLKRLQEFIDICSRHEKFISEAG